MRAWRTCQQCNNPGQLPLTYPVVVDDLNNHGELASRRALVNEDNSANLDKTLEGRLLKTASASSSIANPVLPDAQSFFSVLQFPPKTLAACIFLLLFFFAPLFVELCSLILRSPPRIASIIGSQLTTISSES